jgi:hypothetical protein
MSFVCPNCNKGAVPGPTKFRKARPCTAKVQRWMGKTLVRCNGLVCSECGQCNRIGEHR